MGTKKVRSVYFLLLRKTFISVLMIEVIYEKRINIAQ